MEPMRATSSSCMGSHEVHGVKFWGHEGGCDSVVVPEESHGRGVPETGHSMHGTRRSDMLRCRCT